MTRRRPPASEKTPLERAAVAICRRVYGARCPCEGAPSVCQSMESAARAALSTACPAQFEAVLQDHVDALKRRAVP
jgi:hypothetical protein